MQNKGDSTEFIKWFSELNKNSGNIAGGKGANLSEIYNLGIPVPPGFVVTAQAYDYFMKKAGINKKVKELLEEINYEDTKQLEDITREIRESIINSDIPEEMEEDITEAYENLDTRNLDNAKGSALEILRNSSEPIFVAVRSSATTEDLATASFAGQQDSFVNIKGNLKLLEHIKKCFASLFTARATYYRNKKGFKHEEASLAVVVQKMVDSDKSGVIFSKNPTNKDDNIIIEAVWGLGEGIVSGSITPDNYIISQELEILSEKVANKKIAITRDAGGNKKIVKLKEEKSNARVLKNNEIRNLAEITIKLEDHYKKPQDIEFAIEGEEIHIVQTRPITTTEQKPGGEREIKGEVILTGLAASPGIAYGKIKIIEDLKDLQKIKQGDVLVTKMTNPDMVVTMQKSAAIVTDEGGLTAHAAIVSREMGIPCVVGTQEATTKLKEGEIITVDGFTGKIYKGKTSEIVQKEILPVTAETRTKIKVMVDLPSFAEHAAQTKIKEVGLLRMEGIIAESGKHPEYFLQQNKMQDYEEIIFKGIEKISQYFDELWVRTSDIRTDEFENLEGAPKEKEANPMLGMHGIRYGIKNPEILKSELKALKRIAEKNKKIGLILPQVISVEEVKKVKEFLKEINFNQAKVGVMIETPAAVQLIRDLCEEGIAFISFGTNDLTQYMLAVDRGNQDVQHLYNEMHPAILYQLGYVIRICKRNKVETSICGQAGSKKEMVKFLVEKGIDSISVNADIAKEISDYVAELEKELIKNTDKEPRKYQPEKKEDTQEKSKENFVTPQSTQETGNDNKEDIEKNIQLIEKEKQEYLKEYPEEVQTEPKDRINEEGIIEKEKPNREFPQIRGLENLQQPEEQEEMPNEKIKEENNESEFNSEEEKEGINNIDEEPEFNSNDEIKDDKPAPTENAPLGGYPEGHKPQSTEYEDKEFDEEPEFKQEDLEKKPNKVLDIF